MNASTFLSTSSCWRTSTSRGRTNQLMSLWGSTPTCAMNIETKMCSSPLSSLTAMVLPFRSRVVRTRVLQNSSTHPMWLPPRTTSGAPASI